VGVSDNNMYNNVAR